MIRDTFQNRIKKGLIGPGSDIWGLPDEEEIISDYPLQRYFSGILFPEKKFAKSHSEEDDNQVRAETEEPNLFTPENITLESESDEKIVDKIDTAESEDESKISQNHFYPNNIGLTFCVDKATTNIDVEFSGGFYYEPKQAEIKIQIPEAGYHAFIDENLGFPFKNILVYENGYLSLTRELEGNKGGKQPRSGEYIIYDSFKRSDNFKDSSAKYYIHYFDKLIFRAWKRQHFNYPVTSVLKDTEEIVPIPLVNKTHKEVKIGYHIKTYDVKNNRYVKVQLINISDKQSSKRYTPKTPELNSKCLFQAEIKIKSDKIVPYKSNQELNPFDSEAEELNFLYREVPSFGIGHNCSVIWEKNELKTTFLPVHNIKDIKNDFIESDFEDPNDFKILSELLDIKNLSLFTNLSKDAIIERLYSFAGLYGKWIIQQKDKKAASIGKDKEIGERIISRLEYNYNRLKTNIECLKDYDVFRSFQFANTAMLIQIIISNDKDFTKEEKEKSTINQNIPYNDLQFFSIYDNNKIGFTPKYRPFQLAFLLLSIKSITETQSEERKDVVDLIWFPTGGGKTEAYLAVTAFTISWRRLTHNKVESQGVSVIMRYTLRLLTAQQFERASKLIVALEFLRQNHKDELKDEPISIGLWVGNQLTPGKVLGENNSAEKVIKEIESECQNQNGKPEDKNIFQISSCPWCGTKLISERDYGFDLEGQDFIIKCLNNRCIYYKQLHVQVVDEMLYKHPPTLLFATVDKFAQVAWKADAHKFFNSLNDDKLPPDLIIQDELHLINGPLGSIVGIFESVIEKLCTNESKNLSPKIIASTATLRNTTQQIENLYGGRKVNIFPPSGLSYSDSFFAKESKSTSKRKYIGFMPVGKTAIDTQLQLLAHLLEARIENNEPINDNYWTVVTYFNSLRDVGKIYNKIGDEILSNTRSLQTRLFGRNNPWTYNHFGLQSRTEELTSRIPSSKIKAVLKQLENKFALIDNGDYKNVSSDVIDLVLTTNMFSVGIHVGRLNLMLINGMPKNITEYIQASSRIGRDVEGLVVTLLDSNRARDKSYFEHYIPFHQAFYKSIEPLSVTPFTENTIDKMLTTLMIAFVRHKFPNLNKNKDARCFKKENITPLIDYLKERFNNNSSEFSFFENRINFLANDWEERIQNGYTEYEELMRRPNEVESSDDYDWVVMQSMREVDSDSFIKIKTVWQ